MQHLISQIRNFAAIVTLIAAGSSASSYADLHADSFSQSLYPLKNELTLSGGIAISNLTNGNQSLMVDNTPNDITINTYNAQRNTQVGGVAGVAYSRTFPLRHNMDVTVGPALYYSNLGGASGTEHPSSNYEPDYPTLNYHYLAETFSLLAESRFVFKKYSWQPFFTAGIGPSWNRLSNYGEIPTVQSSTAYPTKIPFVNQTSLARFAYELGFGVQRLFPENERHTITYRVALSYRYLNFGGAQLGAGDRQNTSQAISVSRVDTQALLLSIGTLF